MARIGSQLETIQTEVKPYYDERTERSQESEAGQRSDENLGILRVIQETAQAWPDG